MSHQLVAVHARHFEVGNQKVAADLRDNFGGFESVRGEPDAIAGLFQHAADEFADADGIVRNYDDTFSGDGLHDIGGDTSSGYRFGARSKNARRRRSRRTMQARRSPPATSRFTSISKMRLPSDRNGRAGEKSYTAEIRTKTLDDNFVLAENFVDDDANLFSGYLCDDHVEVAVGGFERRQP